MSFPSASPEEASEGLLDGLKNLQTSLEAFEEQVDGTSGSPDRTVFVRAAARWWALLDDKRRPSEKSPFMGVESSLVN